MAAVSTHPANLGPSPEIVDVESLASALTPENTVLLLGAGASIPCGAPSGKQLAIELSEELRERVVSDDLQEAATILQQTVGRQQVVNAIRSRLMPLKPRGGMTTLPEFDWCAIYTTDYGYEIRGGLAVRSCS